MELVALPHHAVVCEHLKFEKYCEREQGPTM